MKLRPSYVVNPDDLQCLAPGELLNGEVIEACLRVIERRSLCSDQMLSVRAFDSFFFRSWTKGGYNSTKGRAKDTNLFDYDKLLFPLHIPGGSDGTGGETKQRVGHWALIVVCPKQKTMTAFDSLGHDYPDLKTEILAFLRQQKKRKSLNSAWRDEY